MIREWFKNYYIVNALILLCGVGLLIKLITNFVYIRLVRASGKMGSSGNKLVKQMKLKFETFYKLKIGVNNVDIFVDKYVYKYKICGLLLSTWENISGLMLVLCLLISPVASILGLIYDCGEKEILYTFFGGVCTSATLILVDNLFNITSKRQIIKLNIKDYLENYLKVRLEQEAQNPEAFEQYRTELAGSLEKGANPRKLKKEIKRAEKEQKEREKFLELEAKQKEREQRKKDRIERKEAELARKEEEKRRNEEERRRNIEERAEQRRRAIKEKQEEERQRILEKQAEAERIRKETEEKAALKRHENANRIAKKQELIQEKKQGNVEKKENGLSVNTSVANAFGEGAAAKETKKNATSKQAKMQERNERLKEEIQAQREQRVKDRMEGRDPYEAYLGSKKVDNPKSYKVNDFNMEYEMRVKAAQREEAKRKEQQSSVEKDPIGQVAATAIVTAPVKAKSSVVRGNNPSEDKVIDDILKEFLA